MASRSAGIPGIAVALAGVGGYLVFVGIRDVSFVEGLREMLKGVTPTGEPPEKAEVPEELGFLKKPAGYPRPDLGAPSSAAGPLGRRIADTGRSYLGVPYKWGGTTPSGWDCSGFVYFVLNKVGVKVSRMVSTQYLTWSGATTVPRSACAPGDLVCWVGHIGIAVSKDEMVNAPTFGVPTRIQKIRGGAVIRRVKG